MRKYIALMGALTFASFAAQAESVDATMHVQLNVLNSCTLSADTLDFGDQSSAAGEVRADTKLHINCTNGTPYKITTTSDLVLQQTDSTATPVTTVPYKLYADQAGTTAVDDQDGIEGTGTGASDDKSIYGVIAASDLAAAAAGSYADDVSLHLEY